MKGKILAFNESTGEGSISGEDSNRYKFSAEEWKESGRPVRGFSVDFIGVDGKATEIYTAPSFMTFEKKSKILAALLAFFFGGFGIHKFYLGYTTQGFIMLAVSVVGYVIFFIPTLIIGVIAFIEFIIYITKSDADFDEIYVQGHRPWF